MPKPTIINWSITQRDVHYYTARQAKGETWEELFLDFLKETDQDIQPTAEEVLTYSTYFRQKVQRLYNEEEKERELNQKFAKLAEKEIKPEEMIDPKTLLEAANLDPRYFMVKPDSLRYTLRESLTKTNIKRHLSSGAVKVDFILKPYYFDEDKFFEQLKSIKPITVPTVTADEDTFMVIPLFDVHAGFTPEEILYKSRDRIVSRLRTSKRKVTLIPIGQDLLHNNDFRGNTANGTPIEKVDMNHAFHVAEQMYFPIVEEALKTSEKVVISYSKGNHDETSAMAIMRVLLNKYPQCEFDVSLTEYKVYNFYNVTVGYTHSDKLPKNSAYKRLHDLYLETYRDVFTMKHSRYVFTGHFHQESLTEENGTSVWSLATRKPADTWHFEHGFVGSKQVFSIFEFNKDELVAIYKV